MERSGAIAMEILFTSHQDLKKNRASLHMAFWVGYDLPNMKKPSI